jgi:TldD protein
MRMLSRRSFLKTTAQAAAMGMAAPAVPRGWYSLRNAEKAGYFESEFGISDAVNRKILARALAKGGDFADLFFEHTVTNYLILEDGKVNQAFSNVSLGVGVRTVKGDQVGYGFTQELEEKAMLDAASTAATISSGRAAEPAGTFTTLRTKNHYPLKTLLTDVPLQSKVPLVQSINTKCFDRSKLIVKVNAGFYDQQKRILVVTSDGVKAEDLQPRTFLFTTVVAQKDGRLERASWNLGGRRPFSFFTEDVVDEIVNTAVDNALLLFEAAQPPAGEMPVVLGPGITAVLLHEAIGHGMEADFNRKKESTYATMIGKKVAEPFVNIIDDGTIPNLTGSINFDDEATPGQRTMLVEDGILTSYMHDKISARHYKVKATGNGRRQSYQHYVLPRMRNTVMLAGPHSPEEIIGSVKKGIFVQDVSNGEVKIGEGDFAFYVSQGRMIEEGKLTQPIKDVNIMGNGPKMLRDTTMVGTDMQLYKGGGGSCGKGGQSAPCGFGQPSCLVKALTVGGVK